MMTIHDMMREIQAALTSGEVLRCRGVKGDMYEITRDAITFKGTAPTTFTKSVQRLHLERVVCKKLNLRRMKRELKKVLTAAQYNRINNHPETLEQWQRAFNIAMSSGLRECRIAPEMTATGLGTSIPLCDVFGEYSWQHNH